MVAYLRHFIFQVYRELQQPPPPLVRLVTKNRFVRQGLKPSDILLFELFDMLGYNRLI